MAQLAINETLIYILNSKIIAKIIKKKITNKRPPMEVEIDTK